MALAANSVLKILLFYRDDDDAAVWRYISLPAASFASAVSFAHDIAALFVPLTSCALWKIHVVYSVSEDTLPPGHTGAITGNLLRVGTLLFKTEPDHLYAMTIPGLQDSRLIADPEDPFYLVNIDRTNPGIAAIIDALVVGLNGVRPVAPWDDDDINEFEWTGELLSSYEGGYIGYAEP